MPVDKDGRHYTTPAGLASLCELWGLTELVKKNMEAWNRYAETEQGKAHLARIRAKMDANGGNNV